MGNCTSKLCMDLYINVCYDLESDMCVEECHVMSARSRRPRTIRRAVPLLTDPPRSHLAS